MRLPVLHSLQVMQPATLESRQVHYSICAAIIRTELYTVRLAGMSFIEKGILMSTLIDVKSLLQLITSLKEFDKVSTPTLQFSFKENRSFTVMNYIVHISKERLL